MTKPIRVGIIGASANPFAWASTAHVPALQALPDYDLVAVASRNQANADAAAALHGIPHAHGDYREMIERADLDMVIVSTSSAHHHPIVMAAIDAGKHVFCEWPFGTTIDEAIAMRDAAKARGVKTLVGLQGRYSPIVRYVQHLIADGFIGEIWSANFDCANDQTVQLTISQDYYQFLETANAGLRIQGGHALDTLAAYVGEIQDLQAYMETAMDRIKVDTGEILPLRQKDHISVQGRLGQKGVISAFFKQNSPAYKPFNLEIYGSSGALLVTVGSDLDLYARHPGVPSDLKLFGTAAVGKPFEPMDVPADYRLTPEQLPEGQPVDVAHMYFHFARALRGEAEFQTDFDHGVRRHRLLEAITTAAETGQRTTLDHP